MKNFLMLVLLGMMGMSFTSCDNDTAFEDTGEEVGETLEETGDELEE